MHTNRLNLAGMFFLLVFIMLIGIVATAFIVHNVNPSSAASENQNEVFIIPTAEPTDMHPLSWRNQHKATVEAALSDPDLPADTREIYERELAIIQSDIASIANAKATVTASQIEGTNESEQSLNQTPLPQPTMPPFPRGILDDFTSPLPGSVGLVRSAWQDEVDGIWASAYGGAYTQEGNQGFIYVLRWQSREGGVLTEPLPGGLFDAPVQGGALTITDHNNGMLTLKTEDGQTLFFDVRSLEFVSGQ
jgi:hypothetical protein